MVEEDNVDVNSESVDWLYRESEDLWDRLDDSEREKRAFNVLIETIQDRLDSKGVDESTARIAVWVDSLTKEEMREARKRAIKSDSNLDYIDKVSEELIGSYLPVSVK